MHEFLSPPGEARENSEELGGIQWGFVWRLKGIEWEFLGLSGTDDSQRDSRESIRANRFALETKRLIFIARQADSHESLEFAVRANRVIRVNRANRFARFTPLSLTAPALFRSVLKQKKGPKTRPKSRQETVNPCL